MTIQQWFKNFPRNLKYRERHPKIVSEKKTLIILLELTVPLMQICDELLNMYLHVL